MKSRRQSIAVSIGNACLLLLGVWFLIAGPRTPAPRQWSVPVDELTWDEGDQTFRVAVPDPLADAVGDHPPLANGSFLTVDGNLIPLRMSADDGKHSADAAPWHRLTDGELALRLRAGERLEETDRIVLQVTPSPVPRRRNLVLSWLLLAAVGAWYARARYRRWFFSPWFIVVAGLLAALILVVSLWTRPTSWWWAFGGRQRGALVLRFWHDMAPAALVIWCAGGRLSDWRDGRRPGSEANATRQYRSQVWIDRLAQPFSLAAVLSTFAILIGWGPGHPVIVDQTAYSAPFGGAAAQSDAQQYESGAYAVAASGELPQWNQRRPVNTAWTAGRMAVAGMDPVLGMWLQALVMGWAFGRLFVESSAMFGYRAGVFAFALCWAMSRFFVATQLTESFGLIAGALGIAWILWGIRSERGAPFLAGLFFLALAQSARPGAMFVPPLVGLAWALTSSRGEAVAKMRRLALAALVVLLGLGINPLLNRIYGTGTNVTGSNFALTAAGLASGSSWIEVEREFQDSLNAMPDEATKARFLYGIAWDWMRENPGTLIERLVYGLRRFSMDAPIACSTMLVQAPLGNRAWVAVVVGTLWACLCASAGLGIWYGYDRVLRWTMAAMVVGTLASVPIVYLDGGIRVLAATWPGIFVAMAVGLRDTLRAPWALTRGGPLQDTEHFIRRRSRIAVAQAAVAACLLIAAPAMAHLLYADTLSRRPAGELTVGSVETIDVLFAGPPVVISPDDGEGYGRDEFQRAIQIGQLPCAAPLLRAARFGPALFQTCVDRRTLRQWYVLSPTARPLTAGDTIRVQVFSARPPIGLLVPESVLPTTERRGVDAG